MFASRPNLQKWMIYLTTFLTYSSLHSIRTCLGFLKPLLKRQPFNFSSEYLRLFDIIALFTLALFVNLLGGFIEKYNNRKIMFFTLWATIADLFILYSMVKMEVANQIAYLIIYALLGVISCLSWPACLYTLSKYFQPEQSIALSMWSSVSQFGDFIAFTLTEIVISFMDLEGSHSLLALIFLIALMCVVNYFLFEPSSSSQNNKNDQTDLHQQEMQTDRSIRSLEHIEVDDFPMVVKKQQIQRINCLTVWCLPGVACAVLAYSTVKPINAIIIFWIVEYLESFDKVMESESWVIADAWPLGIVIGAFLGSKINQHLSYTKFIVFLIVSGILFIFLDNLHIEPLKMEVLGLLVITSFTLGGPYNQMSSAIPLKLSEDPDIRHRPGAKSAIVALMQGFGQLMCGISVLIIPEIGYKNLHKIATILCLLSAFILSIEIFRQKYIAKTKKRQIPYEPEQQMGEIQDYI